jgi:ribosomal-protein-alanine N-acetyltransferase
LCKGENAILEEFNILQERMGQKNIICETQRLLLRTVTPEDFEDIYEMASDQDVMRFVAGTKSKAETKQWLDWILSAYDRDGVCFWVVELKESGAFIGMVGLLAKEVGALNEIELAYRIKKEFWRNGYAKEAAKACEKYAFETLGIKRMIALIHPDNEASKIVAQRIGMSYEKDVDYQDTMCHVYFMDKSHATAI